MFEKGPREAVLKVGWTPGVLLAALLARSPSEHGLALKRRRTENLFDIRWRAKIVVVEPTYLLALGNVGSNEFGIISLTTTRFSWM
jgi:hypothetical protein